MVHVGQASRVALIEIPEYFKILFILEVQIEIIVYMHLSYRIPAFSVKTFANSTFNMLLFKCRKAEQDIKNMEIIGIE